MKYIVILFDGAADYPIAELDGKTPLEVAYKPNVDKLAKRAELGITQTVPNGMKPGSDVANLAVLGYDPAKYYSGRSPLEALSMGIALKDTQIAIRCNLVTLSDDEQYENKTMIDYSSGEISTEESRELIKYLAEKLEDSEMRLYGGISYRHCLVVDNAKLGTVLTPPHDISGKKAVLPTGLYGERFLAFQKWSYELLKDHPINKKRIAEGKNPANSCWLWGEGVRPKLTSFKEKTGLNGAIISAVDLLKGIGIGAGMEVPDVEGATGNLDTNYSGKARAALDCLERNDYVYVHVEAPDEMGHHGYLKEKIQAIENIDKYIVGPIVDELEAKNVEFKMLICPDHPTPICTRTHASDPVPYLIYDAKREERDVVYNEKVCASFGRHPSFGYNLIDEMLKE